MVDPRTGILYLIHYRQLDALPIFRTGVYSSCKSSAVCIRKATRLAAPDTRDEGILGRTGSWLLVSPPANAAQSKFDNQSRSMQPPHHLIPMQELYSIFTPEKGSFHPLPGFLSAPDFICSTLSPGFWNPPSNKST